MAAKKKIPLCDKAKELGLSTDISHYFERVWTKMKIQLLKLDSLLMSQLRILIQNVLTVKC